MASCLRVLSPTRWRDKQLNSYLGKCGFQQQILQVDPHTTIACWCKPSEAADPQKPALLLIHGFGACAAWQWTKLVKPLLKNFRLFLPDLIFYGKSSTASPHRSEVFQAQMVALTMEAMGVPTYAAVGVSYGSFVAYRLAHLFPDRVDKVVLASSGMCMTPMDTQGLLNRAHVDASGDLFLPRSPTTLRTLLRLSLHKVPPFLPSCVLQDAIQYLFVENRKEREELLDGLLIGKQDQDPLPILSQKVLIIWGEHDEIFPLAMGHRLKEHLKDNAELVVVKNAGHAVQMEKPQEFTRLVETFLLSEDVR